MINYEVDPGVLLPSVPRSTELDAWNNRTFVSVFGFGLLQCHAYEQAVIAINAIAR